MDARNRCGPNDSPHIPKTKQCHVLLKPAFRGYFIYRHVDYDLYNLFVATNENIFNLLTFQLFLPNLCTFYWCTRKKCDRKMWSSWWKAMMWHILSSISQHLLYQMLCFFAIWILLTRTLLSLVCDKAIPWFTRFRSPSVRNALYTKAMMWHILLSIPQHPQYQMLWFFLLSGSC
jgi:hypothetical protein